MAALWLLYDCTGCSMAALLLRYGCATVGLRLPYGCAVVAAPLWVPQLIRFCSRSSTLVGGAGPD